MGRPKGSKNKPKVMVSKAVVEEVGQFLQELPIKTEEDEITGFNFIPDINVRVSDHDTKPTPNGQYYQFMHPCGITDSDGIKHRFLGIIKNGQNYSSLPFKKKEDCHALLKSLIEGDEVPQDKNLILN